MKTHKRFLTCVIIGSMVFGISPVAFAQESGDDYTCEISGQSTYTAWRLLINYDYYYDGSTLLSGKNDILPGASMTLTEEIVAFQAAGNYEGPDIVTESDVDMEWRLDDSDITDVHLVSDGNECIISVDADATSTDFDICVDMKKDGQVVNTERYWFQISNEYYVMYAKEGIKEIELAVGESYTFDPEIHKFYLDSDGEPAERLAYSNEIECCLFGDQDAVFVFTDASGKALTEEDGVWYGNAPITITRVKNGKTNIAILYGNYWGSDDIFELTMKNSSSTAGWQKNTKGYWYQYSDGSYPADQWAFINGQWYHFDSNGYMQSGWQLIGGKWYYLGAANDGSMKTGWQLIGDKWYYFSGNGAMVTGWQLIGGKWYYFSGSGAMVTGWQSIGGKWYYFNTSGAMVTGWQSIGGKWYYFSGSGAMQTGWLKSGGKWYYLSSSGAMVTNTWIGNCYLDSNGVWTKSR